MTQAWQADASGNSGVHFDGVVAPITADIWAPTLTEVETDDAVIPTGAAAVDTGAIAWTIDNTRSRYWSTGSTVTQSVDTLDGTCLELSSTIRLSGGVGTECVAGWESLQIRR